MAQLPSVPTGGSPLYLGEFSKPLYGITQNLTSAMIDQYERRKEEGDQEKAALLKALSFDVVEGLSDNVSRKLLQKQSELEDKWVGKYNAYGNRLPDNELFELQKDKRAYEQYAAKLRSNVANFMYAQKMYTEHPEAYSSRTIKRLKAIADNGEIGDDEALFLLSPLAPIAEDIKKQFGTLASKRENVQKVIQNKDFEKGIQQISFTNEPFIEQQLRPAVYKTFETLINDPDDGPRYKEIADAIIDSYRITDRVDEEPIPIGEINRYEKSKMTPEQRKIKERTGSTVNEDIANIHSHIDTLVTNAFAGDRGALDVFGKKGAARINRDGSIEISYQSGGKTKRATLEPPRPEDTPQVANQKKMALANFLDPNMLKGRTLNPNLFTKSLDEAEVTNPSKYAEVEDAQRLFDANKGETVELNIDGKPSKFTAYSNSHVNVIIDRMKEIFPEDTFKYETFGYGFTWKSGDDSKTFDLKKDSDRKELQNLIEEKVGTISPRSAPVSTPTPTVDVMFELNGTKYKIPTEEVDEFLKENPNAKKI